MKIRMLLIAALMLLGSLMPVSAQESFNTALYQNVRLQGNTLYWEKEGNTFMLPPAQAAGDFTAVELLDHAKDMVTLKTQVESYTFALRWNLLTYSETTHGTVTAMPGVVVVVDLQPDCGGSYYAARSNQPASIDLPQGDHTVTYFGNGSLLLSDSLKVAVTGYMQTVMNCAHPPQDYNLVGDGDPAYAAHVPLDLADVSNNQTLNQLCRITNTELKLSAMVTCRSSTEGIVLNAGVLSASLGGQPVQMFAGQKQYVQLANLAFLPLNRRGVFDAKARLLTIATDGSVAAKVVTFNIYPQ